MLSSATLALRRTGMQEYSRVPQRRANSGLPFRPHTVSLCPVDRLVLPLVTTSAFWSAIGDSGQHIVTRT